MSRQCPTVFDTLFILPALLAPLEGSCRPQGRLRGVCRHPLQRRLFMTTPDAPFVASIYPPPVKPTKEAYQAYRSAFPAVISYEESLGRKNPYTGDIVSCRQDYELYCLSYFLKSTVADEAETLRHRNDTLSQEVNHLQAKLKSLDKELTKSKRMTRIFSICLSLFLSALLFYIFSQLFSSVIDPVFWLYFFIVLFFPTVFLIVLIHYRKKSITSKHTGVIVSLILFLATMIFSFLRHFFL